MGWKIGSVSRRRAGRLGFILLLVIMMSGTVYLSVAASERAGGGLWSNLPESFHVSAAALPSGFIVVDMSAMALPVEGDVLAAQVKMSRSLGIGPLPEGPSLFEEELVLKELTPPEKAPVDLEDVQSGDVQLTCWKEHVVAAGQTLSAICNGLPVTPQDVAKANDLKNLHRLVEGQLLLIPSSSGDVDAVLEEVGRRSAEEEAKQRQAAPVEIREYVVQQGDTLWSVANNFNLDINTLFGCNTLKNPDVLSPGTKLRVPNQDGIFHKVQKGESLSALAKKYGIHSDAVVSANSFSGEAALQIGNELFLPGAKPLVSVASSRGGASSAISGFRWPVAGRISSPFGWRRDPFSGRRDFHTGLDIRSPSGRTIGAAKAGTVVYSGWMGGYGRVIVINHGGGYTTLYAHCSKLLVATGRKVAAGQAIAKVGSSGRSTGSHLHFEVRVNNSPTNPLKVLR